MVRKITHVILLALCLLYMCLFCTGCAINRMDPRKYADELAAQSHLKKEWIETQNFKLLTYQKITEPYKIVHVYIEGDGRSYLTPNQVSIDPTPREPLALKLAKCDPHPNVVYLARPCQYSITKEPACVPEIWSTLRFSEMVINNMNQAISKIKTSSSARALKLFGFSGGAAVATLMAANRKDIEGLYTIAGDLNHEEMSLYHHTMPLDKRSLNPKDKAKEISQIPQHHFVGEKDIIVPSFISDNFIKELQIFSPKAVQKTVLKNATHHRGWEKEWPQLLQKL